MCIVALAIHLADTIHPVHCVSSVGCLLCSFWICMAERSDVCSKTCIDKIKAGTVWKYVKKDTVLYIVYNNVPYWSAGILSFTPYMC